MSVRLTNCVRLLLLESINTVYNVQPEIYCTVNCTVNCAVYSPCLKNVKFRGWTGMSLARLRN